METALRSTHVFAFPLLLIEPLWNGNLLERLSFGADLLLLIEPLWNGNRDVGGSVGNLAKASNRTIVEWKQKKHIALRAQVTCF